LGAKPIGTVGIMGGVHSVPTPFAIALAKLLVHTTEAVCGPNRFVHLDSVAYSDHGPARNTLARQMLGDWLLMFDTDHEPPPDLLVRMLHRAESLDLDVLTGVYRFKGKPHGPVLFARNPESDLILPIAKYPQGIFRVAASGAGCLFVRRAVFDRIESELHENPFDRYAGLSEDHSFCRRLETLQIPLWCDGRIECPHLRTTSVGPDDEDMSGFVESPAFPTEGFSWQLS
jgi:hypothetical protein